MPRVSENLVAHLHPASNTSPSNGRQIMMLSVKLKGMAIGIPL
ncbi:hypothetical protein QEH57_06780 [Pelagicoccus sp. SDUM812005]|nr:hypothetical protein [Pelagicoccus sp. SDUM812005]